MEYGLNSNILTPPFSALLSILLIAGINWLGLRVAAIFNFLEPSAPAWHRWQLPLLGAMLLSVILYPLALADMTPRWFLQAVGITISIIGLFHVFFFLKRTLQNNYRGAYNRIVKVSKNLDFWHLIIIVLLVSMGATSLAAVTNADSLDYHVGVALSILNNGSFPWSPEWFHSRLAGNGEVLIALGLSIGAEQFGSLLQFIGIFAITGLLLKGEPPANNLKDTFDYRPILAVAVVSAPVLLFLISSPKPQMLQIAMTSLAIALVVYPSRHRLSRKETISGFILVCFLVMVASQAKFSFMLSGGAIGLFSFTLMMKRRLYVPAIIIPILVGIIVLGPPMLWEYSHYGGGLFDSLYVPFPGNWPGYDAFESYLRNYGESSIFFPLSLLMTLKVGKISTIIGGGLLILIWLKPGKNPWIWILITLSLFVTQLGYILGQQTSRFFLEPFIWLLMAVSMGPALIVSKPILYLVRWPIAIQAVVVTGLWLYSSITLAPSAISQNMRDKVMERSANGHTIMQWVDVVLPLDAILLSNHRSKALAPRDVVSMDWTSYIPADSSEALPYLTRIKDRGVTHVLVTNNYINQELKQCFGALIAGPFYSRRATRNPQNRGEPYPAWIFNFNSEKLPDCAINNKDYKVSSD